MITLRKSQNRGYADRGWLKSYHSFSFADYYDPAFMGWGNLRVINDDLIAPGTGFGKHGHRDMEIVSYVLAVELAHQDSMGNIEAIPPGDVQRMSAGSGVMHSEFNASERDPVHFLQIWIEPSARGVPPGYEQKHFAAEDRRGKLKLIASPDGGEGSVTIHQDARVYAGLFDGAEAQRFELPAGRHAYVQVARGALTVNGRRLAAGDGARLRDVRAIDFGAGENAEVLLFDLRPHELPMY